MQKKWQITLFTGLFASLSAILFMLLCHNNPTSIVVADNQKVFDRFRMTIEAKREGERLFMKNKTVLDSIYAKYMDPKTPVSEKATLAQSIGTARGQLQDFNEKYAAQQSAKVWARISSYMAEFATQKGYGIIVGKGTSNVLYAEYSKDVTEELIVFLNKKYEGSN